MDEKVPSPVESRPPVEEPLVPAGQEAPADSDEIPVISPVPVAAFTFLVICVVLALWRGASVSEWGDLLAFVGAAFGAVWKGAFGLFEDAEASWSEWVVKRSPRQRAQTRALVRGMVTGVLRVYQALLVVAAAVIAAGIVAARAHATYGADLIRVGGALLGIPVATLTLLWVISTSADEMETDDEAPRRPVGLGDLHRAVRGRQWRYDWPMWLALALIVGGLVIQFVVE